MIGEFVVSGGKVMRVAMEGRTPMLEPAAFVPRRTEAGEIIYSHWHKLEPVDDEQVQQLIDSGRIWLPNRSRSKASA